VQQVPLPELEAGIHAAMSSSAPPADRRAEAVLAFSAWLTARLGEPTADGLLANQMTEAAETQHQIVTVSGLAAHLHVSQRTLQRLSATHVGLSPGMLIRRRRLQDGARRLREQPDLSLTDLAHELGYADHAHLTHDWRTVLGMTPAGYRRDTAPDDPPQAPEAPRTPPQST
jgi:AraC-like DNA-binding protein